MTDLCVDLLDAEAGHALHKVVRALVKLVGFVAHAGNDERGTRFVDEDGVDLVHDREFMSALNDAVLIYDHIVAQIVKAHFVIRAVGYICGIGCLALFVCESVDYKSDRQTEIIIKLAHPFAVTLCEVVIDGDDMNTLSGKCVEVGGKRCHLRFAFAGLHFGDTTLVNYYTADELDAVMACAENAVGCFTYQRERIGEYVVKRFAVCQALLEYGSLRLHFIIAHRGILACKRFYFIDNRRQFLYLFFAVCAEYF